MDFGILYNLAPFVVAVMSFAVVASGILSIYQSRYTPTTSKPDSGRQIDVLPHTITLVLILLLAAAASLLTIFNTLVSDSSISQMVIYLIVFGVTFLQFLLTAVIIAKAMLNPSRRLLGRESVQKKPSQGNLYLSKYLWASTVVYLFLGILTLVFAWHMSGRTLFFLIAAQGCVIMILVFYALERVGELVHESFCLSSLREERAIAIHEGLRDTEFGVRYLNLETVDIELQHSDEQ